MAYEDLTTYDETDPGSKVSVTASKMLATDIFGNTAATHVEKDFGADYFSALDIVFTGCESSHDTGSGMYDTFAVTNSILTDSYNGANTEDLFVGLNDDGGSGVNQRIIFIRGAFVDYSTYNPGVACGSVYYFRLVRTAHGTGASLFIYSDSGLTNLLETLTVSGIDVNRTWRYIMPLTHRVNGTAKKHTIYYESLSLSGPVPAYVPKNDIGFGAGKSYPFSRGKFWR